MDKKELIKRIIFFVFLAVMIGVVVFIMKRYEVEGEKTLPFNIEKILVISTVDGKKNEDAQNLWNISLSQVNDVFIYMNKNEDINKDITIKDITLENFKVSTTPKKGTLKLYRPTGELNNLYTYSQEDYLNKSLTFTGAKIDDLKNLEISNIGGVMAFRTAIENLGSYVSNEDVEIAYNGSLLSKVGITLEDIKFNLSFDMIIQTSDKVFFKGTINTTNFPAGDIITNGRANTEITDFSNIVFKRIQKNEK
ncbi:MAG: hypothetical protein J6J60_01275 [Clostridia bacterium]|nr:hypothetical protein [Clostridia bacterium]